MENYETPDLSELISPEFDMDGQLQNVIVVDDLIDFLKDSLTSVGTLAEDTPRYNHYTNQAHTKCGLVGAVETIRQLIDGLEAL